MDEEPAVSLPLILRHRHDTRDVVFLLTELLFREIAHQVTSLFIIDGQSVEEEWLHIVVERFMVQKEFCQ